MNGLVEIVKAGKEMGLEGEELRLFVKEEEKLEREEREKERERERERERSRALEQEHLERMKKVKDGGEDKLEVQKWEGGELEGDSSPDHTLEPLVHKLPVFNEVRESVDSYILRFERFATNAGLDRSTWAERLALSLQGKALEIYRHLPPAEARDYDCVKNALLRSFLCTAEGYRVKFRKSRFNEDENALEFGSRIKNNLMRWIELSGCEKSFDGLVDLILKEQFLNACDRNMIMFLQEHKTRTFEHVLKFAELYMEAHTTYLKKLPLENRLRKTPSQSAFSSSAKAISDGSEEKPKLVNNRARYLCGRGNFAPRDCVCKFGSMSREKAVKNAKQATTTQVGKSSVVVGLAPGVDVDVIRNTGRMAVLLKRGSVSKSNSLGNKGKIRTSNNMPLTVRSDGQQDLIRKLGYAEK